MTNLPSASFSQAIAAKAQKKRAVKRALLVLCAFAAAIFTAIGLFIFKNGWLAFGSYQIFCFGVWIVLKKRILPMRPTPVEPSVWALFLFMCLLICICAWFVAPHWDGL